MKRLSVIVLTLALGGCMATGQQAAQMNAEDNAACQSAPDYSACRQQLFQYRQLAAQQQTAQLHDFGQRLQRAGAAAQMASPPPPPMLPPPQHTQCFNNAGVLNCTTY